MKPAFKHHPDVRNDFKALNSGVGWHAAASICEIVPLAWVAVLLISSGAKLEVVASIESAIICMAAVFIAMGGRFFCLNRANDNCYGAGFRIGQRIREDIIAHLRRLPTATVPVHGNGGLAALVTDQVNRIEHYYAHVLGLAVTAVLRLVACLGLLFWLDPLIAFVFCSAVAATSALFVLILKKMNVLTANRAHLIAKANNALVNILRNLPVLRAFGVASGRTVGSFGQASEQIAGIYRSALRRIAPLVFSGLIVADLGLIAIILATAFQLGDGPAAPEQNVLTATSFLVAFTALMSIAQMQKLLVHVRAKDSALKEISDFLAQRPLESGRAITQPAGFEIAFENVDFTYPGARSKAIDDLSIRIPERSFLAIVGPSGAGKTTLVELLVRFNDPDHGRITIGGVDLRDLAPDDVAASVSCVLQDMVLFNDTIAGNIAIGRFGSTQMQIVEAACEAGADTFIDTLPDGYTSAVGEAGGMLSGGERARVALARALIKEADILVLDEATAALDPATEARIRDTVLEQRKHHTVILITHRIGLAQMADRIAVLADGRLAGIGSHKDLIDDNQYYQSLWESHLQDLTWKLRPAANPGTLPSENNKHV